MRKQVAAGTVRLMLGVVLGVEGVSRLRGGLVRAMDAMGRKWREVDKRIVGRCMVGWLVGSDLRGSRCLLGASVCVRKSTR